MDIRKTDPIGKIRRWKTIGSLILTGYGLLVYGLISLDGYIKERRARRKVRDEDKDR